MCLEKGSTRLPRCLDDDRVGQLLIEVVPCVFDRNDAAASDVRDHRDLLATVAAQRKQERIHLLIIGLDVMNDVFLTFLRVS